MLLVTSTYFMIRHFHRGNFIQGCNFFRSSFCTHRDHKRNHLQTRSLVYSIITNESTREIAFFTISSVFTSSGENVLVAISFVFFQSSLERAATATLRMRSFLFVFVCIRAFIGCAITRSTEEIIVCRSSF